jgi:hypothetical protein
MSKSDHEKNEEQNRMRNDSIRRREERREDERKAAGLDRHGRSTSNGSGCFPAGTAVATPAGLQDIAALHAGDVVLGVCTGTGLATARRILHVRKYTGRRLWTITLVDGSVLRTTAWHSYAVGTEWKRSRDLKAGDVLTRLHSANADGVVVAASAATSNCADVYNIIVEGDFTFVADGMLVHSFSYLRGLRVAGWTAYAALRYMVGRPRAVLRTLMTN